MYKQKINTKWLFLYNLFYPYKDTYIPFSVYMSFSSETSLNKILSVKTTFYTFLK